MTEFTLDTSGVVHLPDATAISISPALAVGRP